MPTKLICLCGTIEGGPHDRLCPYPYYGNDPKLESQWMDAWRMKRNDQEARNLYGPTRSANSQDSLEDKPCTHPRNTRPSTAR